MTDIEKAICSARRYERLLEDRYRARGGGLTQLVRSVSANLRGDMQKHLLYVAKVRNRIAHENINSLPDPERFERACAALDEFFSAPSLLPLSEPPSWTQPLELSAWNRVFHSSQQKRLYAIANAKVEVFEPGRHRLPFRGIDEAGYVWMLPQQLPDIRVDGLLTADDLPCALTAQVSACIIDDAARIASVILSADEEIDILRTHMVLSLQRICARLDYMAVLRQRHEIARELKEDIERQCASHDAFQVVACALVDCNLEDEAIDTMRRGDRSSAEESKILAQADRRRRELELAEKRYLFDKLELDGKLAVEAQLHETELDRLRREMELSRERQQRELSREMGRLDRKEVLEASREDVEIGQNQVRGQLAELEVAREKAGIAALSAGKYVLFPVEQFGIDRARLTKEAEFWRANYSDLKVHEFLKLVAKTVTNQGQLEQLKSLIERFTAVSVTERVLDGESRGDDRDGELPSGGSAEHTLPAGDAEG